MNRHLSRVKINDAVLNYICYKKMWNLEIVKQCQLMLNQHFKNFKAIYLNKLKEQLCP